MKLVILGSTGYHPTDSRQTACLMLPELGIVLDAGTGMYRVREFLTSQTLDIFLSHAHLDHIVGLTFLFDVLYERSVQRITVHGEAAKLRAIQEHLLAELLFPVQLPCEFRELRNPTLLAESGELVSFPLEHPSGSLGFRLNWPQSTMAYVTDTTASPDAAYVDHIRGVDLLVHECYFPDAQRELAIKTGHSHTTPVAQVAREAQVGRLVLVHVNPLDDGPDPIGIDVARAIFPRATVAEDWMELDF